MFDDLSRYNKTPEIYLHAKQWHERGISVYPAIYGSKKPHYQALQSRGYINSETGKAEWKTLQSQLPSEDDLRLWFTDTRLKNLAVITTDRLIALDFDNIVAYWQFRRNYPHLLDTLVNKSGKGYHLYFWLKEPITERYRGLKGVEIKYGGMSITFFGRHKSGLDYQIENDVEPLTVENIDVLVNTGFVEKIVNDETEENNRVSEVATSFLHLTQRREASPCVKPDKKGKLKFGSIPEIKKRLPILGYLSVSQIESSSGDFVTVHCPSVLHTDNHPSFWIKVSGDKSICGCHSQSCELHGTFDIIDLHAKLHAMSKSDAVYDLAEKVGLVQYSLKTR